MTASGTAGRALRYANGSARGLLLHHHRGHSQFFRVKMRERVYDSVESLQTDLDACLALYNTDRPHLCYRNMGQRPVETIMCSIPDDYIDPRRSALFVARSILREVREGVRAC